jgi:ADP-heptose:LPS heptosyltransferase
MGATTSRRLFAAKPAQIFSSSKRILVCLRHGIGDVVMELPILHGLRQASPQAHISALGSAPAVQLVQRDRCMDAITSMEQWGIAEWHDEGDAQSDSAIHQWLEQNRFDMILDVSHAALGVRKAITATAQVPLLDTDYVALNSALMRGCNGMQAIKAGIESGWGLPVAASLSPQIQLSGEDIRYARGFFCDHDLCAQRVVGVSLEASSQLKKCPIEAVAAALDKVVDATNCSLLLFAAPDSLQADLVATFMRHCTAVHLVQSYQLRHIAALLRRCSVFLCNESGLMHIAAAVGTPVTAIFGPTWPGIYLPSSSRSRAVGGWRQSCPYRIKAAFGPPLCIGIGACLNDEQGCIAQVSADEIYSSVLETMLPGCGSSSEAELDIPDSQPQGA